jgi:hypothetical protein
MVITFKTKKTYIFTPKTNKIQVGSGQHKGIQLNETCLLGNN